MKTIFPCWDNGVKSYEKGGRVQCDICGSFKGVYAKNYLRKNKEGKTFLKLFRRCANCRSLEVTNNYSGEILRQEKNKHKLLIKSLYDAQAECICGKWYFCVTGERGKKEIEKEFNKHMQIGR